jgi:hypothetical protein
MKHSLKKYSANNMTFSAFRRTRKACKDFRKAGYDSACPDDHVGGYVYDDFFTIEDSYTVKVYAPDFGGGRFRVHPYPIPVRYWLHCSGNDYYSDDLQFLEKRLYDWATDHGYFNNQ